MSNFHITIIGAGLGGLCLAQALKGAGVPFDLFERDPAPDSRVQGYRIRIDANGQDALASCLPAPLYRLFRETCAVATSTGRFLTPQFEAFAGHAPASWRPAASDDDEIEEGADLSANRQTLREILLSGIEDHVHFGKTFRRFDLVSQDDLRINFEDGTSILSSLLVGADGVNSAVRRQLTPSAEPVDTGTVCIYGKSVMTAGSQTVDPLAHGTTVVFADGYAAILDAMRFRAPLPMLAAAIAPECDLSPVADYIYWALIAPNERLGLADGTTRLRPDELGTVVSSLTTSWHPHLRRVFDSSDPRTLAMLPIRNGRPDAAWPWTRATLLGDAIHVMSPAGGLGANAVLRDAHALGVAIAETCFGRQEMVTAIGAYEVWMRKRGGRAIEISTWGASTLFSSHQERRIA